MSTEPSADAPSAPPPALPRQVLALGWVSLLTDAASDMIYPLLPAFLMSLGGGATALGWVEGVAEGVSAIVKLMSGRASDKSGKRRRLVMLGYGVSAAARPFFALAMAPWHAVLVRTADRVGKGVRGPPRDAILASAVGASQRGHAFGFHRMMDNFGGVLGPALAFLFLRLAEVPIRTMFVLSVVPGALSVLVILLFVKEPASENATEHGARATATEPIAPPTTALPRGAVRYLAVLGVFALASSGDLFLMRRLTDLGMHLSLVPLAWVSLNLGKGLLNVPGGRASDRYGRRRVLAIAWVLYAATYAGFALAPSWPVAWLLIAVYAAHYGLAEGGQRALLAEYVSPEMRGRVFGIQLAIEGLMVLPANVVFGWIYDNVGAPAAFAGGGAIAFVAALGLEWLVPSPPGARESARQLSRSA